jgi:molecular chaperone DnaK
VRRAVAELFGREPDVSQHPDEAVAVGATIQAGVMSGALRQVVLLDVTPLSLGVESYGGLMNVIIPRNTTIPCKAGEMFTNAAAGQRSMRIRVLQGEREMARDNRPLGKFHLEGLPPAPRGVPQIEVTFDIDANGILNVSAKDKGTGKETKITITHSSGLAKDEVEKMVSDARAHESEDKQRREEVETRNRAENLAYQVEKLVKENKEKLDADTVKEMEEAVAAVHGLREKGSVADLKAATERLEKASHKAAEVLYKSAAPGPEAGSAGGAPPPAEEKKKDDVVDAEFKQV